MRGITMLGLLKRIALIGVVGWLIIGVVCWWRSVERMMNLDCATASPAELFSLVFQSPVPPGVSQVDAAGHAGMGGSDVWMRFRATPEAVQLLSHQFEPDPYRSGEGDVHDQCREWLRMEPYGAWARLAHWDQVLRLRKPEVHYYRPSSGSNLTLVVDPQRHLVYAYLWCQ